MTNLEFLHDLNRRHTRLESDLSALKLDLQELRLRLDKPESVIAPPPLPVALQAKPEPATTIELPPLPMLTPFAATMPETRSPATAPAPAVAPTKTAGPGFELRLGRLLAPIGVVFALLTLVSFSILAYKNFYHYLGPWSKLTIFTFVSSGLIAAGMWMEGRDKKLVVYGRTVAAGGLACLYYTIYGASYVPQLQVITSPLLGGLLLLAWSAGVLKLAQSRRSELLSIFAISLAYFSSAITPSNGFVMTADLILAATAVIFLVRNAWTSLSYLCLIGTYAGFLRQAVDYRGPLDFNWIGTLPFWPSAVYLTGAWIIFTAGILLSRTPDFVSGKRMAFLCLNDGAWVGLLVVAAWLGDYPHMGGIFGTVGGVLLISYALARVLHPDARDLASAYLAQGLAFGTGGIAIATSGVTRGLLITIESVFLVASGAFSRNLILRIGGGITAIIGACFLAAEIGLHDAHPWILTFGGTLAMLANAWLERVSCSRARKSVEVSPQDSLSNSSTVSRRRLHSDWIPSSALYSILALGLLVTGIVMHAPDNWIGPDLAFAALALTFAVYVIPIFELPIPAQALLVFAQLVSFAPALLGKSAGNPPQWSLNLVALVTMALATWWPRQKLSPASAWLTPLSAIYALAMTAFCYSSIQPHASEQTWMISAALLSLAFLAYGAWNRLPAFMASGQILLGCSVFTFLNRSFFPWTWWAAAIPIAVVFATGWIARGGFLKGRARARPGPTGRSALQIVARIYQSIAIGLLIRWVFGVLPSPEITLALMALGTAFVVGGTRLSSNYAVRAGFVLSAAAGIHYLASGPDVWTIPFTWLDASAFALFLAQPALLRKAQEGLISKEESWALVVVSSAMAWMFVSNSVNAAEPSNLTIGWALFALALLVVGFISNERRQRWCGLAVLVAAFVRVAVHDFWGYSDLAKVVTFLVLTVICLGLSFLYYKFADRLKEWL